MLVTISSVLVVSLILICVFDSKPIIAFVFVFVVTHGEEVVLLHIDLLFPGAKCAVKEERGKI